MKTYHLKVTGFRTNIELDIQGGLIVPEETALEMVEEAQILADAGKLLVYKDTDTGDAPRLSDAVAKVTKVVLQAGWVYATVETIGNIVPVVEALLDESLGSVTLGLNVREISANNPPLLYEGEILYLTFVSLDGKKSEDLSQDEVTRLNDVAMGRIAQASLEDLELCESCKGTGKLQTRNGDVCPPCGGSGFKSEFCPECLGTGRTTYSPSESNPCPQCCGSGRIAIKGWPKNG